MKIILIAALAAQVMQPLAAADEGASSWCPAWLSNLSTENLPNYETWQGMSTKEKALTGGIAVIALLALYGGYKWAKQESTSNKRSSQSSATSSSFYQKAKELITIGGHTLQENDQTGMYPIMRDYFTKNSAPALFSSIPTEGTITFEGMQFSPAEEVSSEGTKNKIKTFLNELSSSQSSLIEYHISDEAFQKNNLNRELVNFINRTLQGEDTNNIFVYASANVSVIARTLKDQNEVQILTLVQEDNNQAHYGFADIKNALDELITQRDTLTTQEISQYLLYKPNYRLFQSGN